MVSPNRGKAARTDALAGSSKGLEPCIMLPEPDRYGRVPIKFDMPILSGVCDRGLYEYSPELGLTEFCGGDISEPGCEGLGW
jgi:hypothetical protein